MVLLMSSDERIFHGKYQSWWPNGNKKEEGQFNHGEADGVWSRIEALDPEQPDETVRLSTLQPGDRARVARLGDEEPEFLAYVDRLGLRPDACLIVTERAPYKGPLMIAVGERLHALGDAVAREIWVEKLGHD